MPANIRPDRTVFLTVLLGILLALAMLPHSAAAKSWYILPDGSGDAPTIQAGVDSAAAGDTVLLATGTFTGVGNRDVDYLGKAITITSEHGPDSSIVDCQKLGRGFVFDSDEGPESVLSGLTIKNGDSDHNGGGVYIWDAGPSIIGNKIKGNTAGSSGGGIYHTFAPDPIAGQITDNIISGNTAGFRGGGMVVQSGSPLVTGNRFSANEAEDGGGMVISTSASHVTGNLIKNNTATVKGGGLYVTGSGKTPTIDGNTIVDNTSGGTGGGVYADITAAVIENTVIAGNQAGTLGGGVYCWVEGDPTIRNCTIVGNGGGASSGGVVATDGSPTIDKTIIAFNTAGAAMQCFGSAAPIVSCSDLYGNPGGDAICGIDGGDNISVDPLFCDATEDDYTLDPASLCAPANSPCALLIGALPEGCATAATEPQYAARETTLFQNVPNPFNPSTTIRYTIAAPGGRVTLGVYDVAGRLVCELIDGPTGPGEKAITWNATNNRGEPVASGVYFYRLTAPGFQRTMKLVVLK